MGIFKKKTAPETYIPVRYENLMPVDINSKEFCSAGIYTLMPRPEKIPQAFLSSPGYLKWEKVADQWFSQGLKEYEFIPWEGVDGKLARMHVFACISSWEPSHENKIMGCAYLMNEFFKDIVKKYN